MDGRVPVTTLVSTHKLVTMVIRRLGAELTHVFRASFIPYTPFSPSPHGRGVWRSHITWYIGDFWWRIKIFLMCDYYDTSFTIITRQRYLAKLFTNSSDSLAVVLQQ